MIKHTYLHSNKILVVTHGGVIKSIKRVLNVKDDIDEIDDLHTFTIDLNQKEKI